jgi:hypothetical protein
MPHPAHFICSYDCKFFLATKVGKYIVSTVGEYFPDSEIREIYAKSRGVKLEGMGDARRADYMKKIGFEEIGYGRKYETMVFKAVKSPKCKACPFVIKSGNNIDGDSYNEPEDAYKGHLKMCLKYAK